MNIGTDGLGPLLVTPEQAEFIRRKLAERVVGNGRIQATKTGDVVSITGLDDTRHDPAALGGGGVGVKTVRIVAITPLLFSCRDHDINGNEVGTAFDVYPWVVDADGYMPTGYDLTSTGLPRVIPKYTVGRYLRIFSSQLAFRRAAPGGPTVDRYWAMDTFHMVSCEA